MSVLGISIRSALLAGMNHKPILLSTDEQASVVELIQNNRTVSGNGIDKGDKEKMVAFFGGSADDYSYDRSYLYADGIAYIPMYGTLLNRLNFSGYGVTGYDYLRGAFNDAMNADDVQGIVFDINSGGGSVYGNFELADYIRGRRGEKPMIGVINSVCCSGAYSLGSALDSLIATPSADVGSIGAYSMHVDISKAMENFGVAVNFIFAGDHKIDGNMFEPLPDAVRTDIQAGVDESYQKFTALVALNRNMDQADVVKTQARVFGADEALSLHLVDSVAPANEAIATFKSGLSGSAPTNTGVTRMNTKTNPAGNNASAEDNEQKIDVAGERAAAVAADRDRRKAITNCEEAKGREQLASHLADNTDIDADAAKGILSAAPKKGADAPAGKDHFSKAMSSTENPELTDEGSQASGNEDRAQRLINNGRKAGISSLRAVK